MSNLPPPPPSSIHSLCSACCKTRVTTRDRLINQILLDRLVASFPASAHHFQLDQRVCEKCAAEARRDAAIPLPPVSERPASRGKAGKKVNSSHFHPSLCAGCISSSSSPPSTSSDMDISPSKPVSTSRRTTFVNELKALPIIANYTVPIPLETSYHFRDCIAPLLIDSASTSPISPLPPTSPSAVESLLTMREAKMEKKQQRAERATRERRVDAASFPSSPSGPSPQGAQGGGSPPLTVSPSSTSPSPPPIRVFFSSLKTSTYHRILNTLIGQGFDVVYCKSPVVPATLAGFDYVFVGHDWIDCCAFHAAAAPDYGLWLSKWRVVVEAAGLIDRVYPRLDDIDVIVSKRYQLSIPHLLPPSTHLYQFHSLAGPTSSSSPLSYDWNEIHQIVDGIADGTLYPESELRIRVKAGYSCKGSERGNVVWRTGVKVWSDEKPLSSQLGRGARANLEKFLQIQLDRGVGHICFQEQLHYYRPSEQRFLVVRDEVVADLDVKGEPEWVLKMKAMVASVVECVWHNDPPLFWRLDLIWWDDVEEWYVGEIEMLGAEYESGCKGEDKYKYINRIANVLANRLFLKTKN